MSRRPPRNSRNQITKQLATNHSKRPISHRTPCSYRNQITEQLATNHSKRPIWHRALLVAALLLLCLAAVLAMPAAASAHPLGNFTVNHHNTLTLHPGRVDLRAVVDQAEIPTVQEVAGIDRDRDGTVGSAEADTYAWSQCADLGRSVSIKVAGQSLAWQVTASLVEFPPGEAGLATTRLTCELSTPADLDREATVSVRDNFRGDRVGWHELVVTSQGVAPVDSPVPARSVSNELRAYPDDLLADPLDVREATLLVRPGTGVAGPAGDAPSGGGLASAVSAVTGWFTNLAGSKELTPVVGLLALLLSVVLGASHAALPGHGKTVIAAYLAGQRGSTRDALMVGATVTVTHTGGVLVLGLLISASSTIAGESVLGWLGVLSGLLVAGIGTGLLRSALRQRAPRPKVDPVRLPSLVGAGAPAAPPAPGHGHGHGHGYGYGYGYGHGHGFGRAGLIGMGVAGGLVPSPSALVVLLGAVALGRTWFGVLLVLGYGLGMAGTLTLVGILLVRLRDRLARMDQVGRLRQRIGRISALMPVLTATLVLVVGIGLAARALSGIG